MYETKTSNSSCFESKQYTSYCFCFCFSLLTINDHEKIVEDIVYQFLGMKQKNTVAIDETCYPIHIVRCHPSARKTVPRTISKI